jgi:hypothetical protein
MFMFTLSVHNRYPCAETCGEGGLCNATTERVPKLQAVVGFALRSLLLTSWGTERILHALMAFNTQLNPYDVEARVRWTSQ